MIPAPNNKANVCAFKEVADVEIGVKIACMTTLRRNCRAVRATCNKWSRMRLLLELMVLFRTKRFLSLWRVNRWTSKLQEKILIRKLQALHIFARLCSVSVGPHPHFSFPQNDLRISSTRLSWKQLSAWYIVCVPLLPVWLCLWHHLHICCALATGKLYAECTVERRFHRTFLCEKYFAKSQTKAFKQTNFLRFV